MPVAPSDHAGKPVGCCHWRTDNCCVAVAGRASRNRAFASLDKFLRVAHATQRATCCARIWQLGNRLPKALNMCAICPGSLLGLRRWSLQARFALSVFSRPGASSRSIPAKPWGCKAQLRVRQVSPPHVWQLHSQLFLELILSGKRCCQDCQENRPKRARLNTGPGRAHLDGFVDLKLVPLVVLGRCS